MTAGDLYTVADVGVSGAPSTSILMGDVAASSNGLSVDPSGNIVVGDGDGAYFVNEQTSGSLSLYGKTIQHQAAAVIAGSAQGGTDCSAGAAHAAASWLYFQSAAPFVDSSDNVYLNDNEIGGVNGGGCDWVLPAQTGTFNGQSVTAGNVYKLAGNGGTTATPDGTAGINANVSGTSQMALDLAGNVVLGIESGTSFGTSPAIQILAQSTCASACAYGLASTTAGDIYTVAGGPSNTLATLSGPTSVLSDGTGNLYFTDGATSSANLDELTGGPTQAAPTVTGVSPTSGPRPGAPGDHHRHRLHRGHRRQLRHHRGHRLHGQLAPPQSRPPPGRAPARSTSPSPRPAAPRPPRPLTSSPTSRQPSDGHRHQPDLGPDGRRHQVTITGTGFTGATAVNFGTTAATSFTVNCATSITATSPAGHRARSTSRSPPPAAPRPPRRRPVHLRRAAPRPSPPQPDLGPDGRRHQVTITGTNFTGATAVKFGTTAATGVHRQLAPPRSPPPPRPAPGTVDVTVTTPGGTSATSAADQFTYVGRPDGHRRSARPRARRRRHLVTITGTGFTGATAVNFGTTAATGVTVNSRHLRSPPPPPAGTGTVDVTVTTPGGTSATSSGRPVHLRRRARPSPAISPTSGSDGRRHPGDHHRHQLHRGHRRQLRHHRGHRVTVNSRHPDHRHLAGRDRARSTSRSPPPAAPRPPRRPTSSPTWPPRPSPASARPRARPPAAPRSPSPAPTSPGPPRSTSAPPRPPASRSTRATQITATIPAGTGTVDVTVTTPGGTSATSRGRPVHLRRPRRPSPPSARPPGPAAGGTTVTITGTGFTGATAVNFGTTAATAVTVNSRHLRSRPPPRPGPGRSTSPSPPRAAPRPPRALTSSPTGAPRRSPASPRLGPAAGGTSVTITGTNFTGATAVKFGTSPPPPSPSTAPPRSPRPHRPMGRAVGRSPSRSRHPAGRRPRIRRCLHLPDGARRTDRCHCNRRRRPGDSELGGTGQ